MKFVIFLQFDKNLGEGGRKNLRSVLVMSKNYLESRQQYFGPGTNYFGPMEGILCNSTLFLDPLLLLLLPVFFFMVRDQKLTMHIALNLAERKNNPLIILLSIILLPSYRNCWRRIFLSMQTQLVEIISGGACLQTDTLKIFTKRVTIIVKHYS